MPFLLFLGPLLKSPTAWLAIALAISLLGSAGLYKLHIHDIQRIAVLKERNTEAIADAKACSDGVARAGGRAEQEGGRDAPGAPGRRRVRRRDGAQSSQDEGTEGAMKTTRELTRRLVILGFGVWLGLLLAGCASLGQETVRVEVP